MIISLLKHVPLHCLTAISFSDPALHSSMPLKAWHATIWHCVIVKQSIHMKALTSPPLSKRMAHPLCQPMAHMPCMQHTLAGNFKGTYHIEPVYGLAIKICLHDCKVLFLRQAEARCLQLLRA